MDEQERTQVTDDVFLEIARSAMQAVNEVARQEKKGALAELTQLFSERIAPQIVVKRAEAEIAAVTFEIKLTLIYGVRIPEVVEKVRAAVKAEASDAKTQTSLERRDINESSEDQLTSAPADLPMFSGKNGANRH